MNRRQENDPDRDRYSRNTRTDEIVRDDLTRNRAGESELGRAQRDGNLGNERTRDDADDRTERDRSRRDRDL